jgi:predicted TIM-barrel fold metal-dependent hydrolase
MTVTNGSAGEKTKETPLSNLIDFRIKPPVRDSDSDPEVEIASGLDQYEELYGMHERMNTTFEQLVTEMETFGVRGIIQAEFEQSGRTPYWNERVRELVDRRPDLFLGGMSGIDPRDPDAMDQLEWAHDELGLRGVVMQPGFIGLPPTDTCFYPVYSYCQRRGVPVTLHTGVNFTKRGPIDCGRPVWVDRVACDFPDLTLVCNHGGWPWVTEAMAVAWKHQHVYLEFGAIAPKYLADPRGGWQPVVHWMRNQLREKVLLGTDWPMLRYERLVAELPLLELPEAASEAYLHGNAERIISRVWAPANA